MPIYGIKWLKMSISGHPGQGVNHLKFKTMLTLINIRDNNAGHDWILFTVAWLFPKPSLIGVDFL